MKFTEYQTNNIKSLITYLEDCTKYDQEFDDLIALENAIRALRGLKIDS